MKRSELKQLIKEVIQELSSDQWDVDDLEIVHEGQPYWVSAKFLWERKAVDYAFDPRKGKAGQGQDTTSEVPVSVESIVAWDKSGAKVTDLNLLKGLGEHVMQEFADSEEGKRNSSKGQWM